MEFHKGRLLGIRPNLLQIPPALKGEGLEILNLQRNLAGATDAYKSAVELVLMPWPAWVVGEGVTGLLKWPVKAAASFK